MKPSEVSKEFQFRQTDRKRKNAAIGSLAMTTSYRSSGKYLQISSMVSFDFEPQVSIRFGSFGALFDFLAFIKLESILINV